MSLSFETLIEFESVLSKYTGAPYVVLTDSCTHAVELCMRLKTPGPCVIPAHTYVSIPMIFYKLGVPFYYDTHLDWEYEYRLAPSSNKDEYTKLKRMAYDGRDLQITPWQDQQEWNIGYHYGMRLEDAQLGIQMMANGNLNYKESQLVEYPDCSKLNIDKSPK